jgi:hypothetical protein
MMENGSIFDIAVANSLIANEEKDVLPFILSHYGNALLRTKAGEEVDSMDPLFDSIVPTIEPQRASHDLLGKAERGCGAGFRIAVSIF